MDQTTQPAAPVAEHPAPPLATSKLPSEGGFRALALLLATRLYEDIHVNLAGVVFFTVLAAGIIHPELKDQCQQLVALAGTYLFAASKTR